MSITHTIQTHQDSKNRSDKFLLVEAIARNGLRRFFGFDPSNPQTETDQDIVRRLDTEIKAMALSRKVDQYLMMWDIIRFAYVRDIPVSPGYGSSPGSLLAYVLHITKVDPYRFNLIDEDSSFFGTTLGINISADRCDEVIRYLKRRYRVDGYCNPIELVEMPGLDTMQDIVQKTEWVIVRRTDLDKIPFDDKETFELLRRGDTAGVYQLESRSARRYLVEWDPTSLNDIFALTALNRPGAEDIIPLIIACRRGENPVTFYHPLLEPVTAETCGFIIYHEQLIRATKVLAGYTSDQGEMLRLILRHKRPYQLDEARLKFAEACGRVNAIPLDQANELFDILDRFSGYTFLKAHAVAQGIVTYQMAYLKAQHPSKFATAIKEGKRRQRA